MDFDLRACLAPDSCITAAPVIAAPYCGSEEPYAGSASAGAGFAVYSLTFPIRGVVTTAGDHGLTLLTIAGTRVSRGKFWAPERGAVVE